MEDELTIYASTWLQPLIEELLSHPIAPQRLRSLRSHFDQQLRERAINQGTTPDYQIRLAASKAISLAMNGLHVPARLFNPNENDAPAARCFVTEAVRQRVNNLVTEDLLGPGWRHIEDSIEDAVSLSLDEATSLTSSSDSESLDLPASLSERERELILTLCYSADSVADAARAMGIVPSTANTMMQRIRKKFNL